MFVVDWQCFNALGKEGMEVLAPALREMRGMTSLDLVSGLRMCMQRLFDVQKGFMCVLFGKGGNNAGDASRLGTRAVGRIRCAIVVAVAWLYGERRVQNLIRVR